MAGPLHLHLDPVGGVAGDMFIAALLDAWPDLTEGAIAAARAAGLGEEIAIEHRPHQDGLLVGGRFFVAKQEGRGAGHQHVHWRGLRKHLNGCQLDTAVRERALAIFALLAEAEAGVHGVPVDEATFHEVGAWDSIADIVAAAFLIEAVGVDGWSVGALPLGRGRVRCAHGDLPVPAPATLRLLEGFAVHDDGLPGERVTPTGAAILKHLEPLSDGLPTTGRLIKTGHGFGARRLEGISNVLRLMAFEMLPYRTGTPAANSVAVLSFEVDDQTPEDLALGLDHLRAEDAVLDIVQTPVFAKKGRLSTSLRLLVQPEAVDAVIKACFAETTTLGVRWHIEQRTTLSRSMTRSEEGIAVKLAERPGVRVTAKAESDDLAGLAGHAERDQARRTAELAAVSRKSGKDQT